MLFICYDSILTLYVQKYGNNDVIDKDKAIPRQRMNGKKQHLYKEMRAENQTKSNDNKKPIYIACKYWDTEKTLCLFVKWPDSFSHRRMTI